MFSPWTRLTRGRTYRFLQPIRVRGQPSRHTRRVPKDLLRRLGCLIHIPVNKPLTDQLVQDRITLRCSLSDLVLLEFPDGVKPYDIMVFEVCKLEVVPTRNRGRHHVVYDLSMWLMDV